MELWEFLEKLQEFIEEVRGRAVVAEDDGLPPNDYHDGYMDALRFVEEWLEEVV